MGVIISKFQKGTAVEQLEDIAQKIKSIEKFHEETEHQSRRVIGKLISSSIMVYLAALVIYFCCLPSDTFVGNIFKFLPLLIFPVAIYLTGRILSWYYKRKLSNNKLSLENLKLARKKMLDDVKGKEVYNVAREILEKFAPEQLNKDLNTINHDKSSHHDVAKSSKQFDGSKLFPQEGIQKASNPSQLQQKLSLPRPVLPPNKGGFDKLIDAMIGDGPGNRYALICRTCSCHNGMALKNEFEFIAFRCAYCLQWNSARKQRPTSNSASNKDLQNKSNANSETVRVGQVTSSRDVNNHCKSIDSDSNLIAFQEIGEESTRSMPDLISPGNVDSKKPNPQSESKSFVADT